VYLSTADINDATIKSHAILSFDHHLVSLTVTVVTEFTVLTMAETGSSVMVPLTVMSTAEK